MRHVDNEGGVEFVAERLHRGDVGRIRVHREQALGHHHDAVLGVLGTDAAQQASAVIDVEVPEDRDIAGRRIGSLLQARMGERIHHHVIVGADQTLDDAEAGREPCRVEDGLLDAEEFCDAYAQAATEALVFPTRAGEPARVHAIALDGVEGRVLDGRVRREA